MDKLSPDMLIYILVIAGILIFNYLAQRAAAKRQQEEPASGEPPAQPDPFEEIFGRKGSIPAGELPPESLPALVRVYEAPPAPVPVAEARRVAVSAAAPRRRSAARALLQGKGNLQRAVVVMTVLGPCRAMEPGGAAHGGALGRPSS